MSFCLRSLVSKDHRIYNHLHWGIIVSIFHDIAQDFLTQQEFTDLSYNHRVRFSADTAQELGRRLEVFVSNLERDSYIATTGEISSAFSGPICSVTKTLKDKDYTVSRDSSIIWPKEDLIDLVKFLKSNQGFLLS